VAFGEFLYATGAMTLIHLVGGLVTIIWAFGAVNAASARPRIEEAAAFAEPL
jgi:hypothetical protein